MSETETYPKAEFIYLFIYLFIYKIRHQQNKDKIDNIKNTKIQRQGLSTEKNFNYGTPILTGHNTTHTTTVQHTYKQK